MLRESFKVQKRYITAASFKTLQAFAESLHSENIRLRNPEP
jgi:hypothetical protein